MIKDHKNIWWWASICSAHQFPRFQECANCRAGSWVFSERGPTEAPEKRAARRASQGRWKRHHARRDAWIAVDLDGTWAEYTTWLGAEHVGPAIKIMTERVKKWLAAGMIVKVFTARFAEPDPAARGEVVRAIQDFTQREVGQRLEVTNVKDYSMLEQWDDRAVQVIANTGWRADGEPDPCCYDGSCSECFVPACQSCGSEDYLEHLIPETPPRFTFDCARCGAYIMDSPR